MYPRSLRSWSLSPPPSDHSGKSTDLWISSPRAASDPRQPKENPLPRARCYAWSHVSSRPPTATFSCGRRSPPSCRKQRWAASFGGGLDRCPCLQCLLPPTLIDLGNFYGSGRPKASLKTQVCRGLPVVFLPLQPRRASLLRPCSRGWKLSRRCSGEGSTAALVFSRCRAWLLTLNRPCQFPRPGATEGVADGAFQSALFGTTAPQRVTPPTLVEGVESGRVEGATCSLSKV